MPPVAFHHPLETVGHAVSLHLNVLTGLAVGVGEELQIKMFPLLPPTPQVVRRRQDDILPDQEPAADHSQPLIDVTDDRPQGSEGEGAGLALLDGDEVLVALVDVVLRLVLGLVVEGSEVGVEVGDFVELVLVVGQGQD